jgi:hypothetical protein
VLGESRLLQRMGEGIVADVVGECREARRHALRLIQLGQFPSLGQVGKSPPGEVIGA